MEERPEAHSSLGGDRSKGQSGGNHLKLSSTDAFLNQLAAAHVNTCDQISADVQAIRAEVANLDPLQLMLWAFFERAKHLTEDGVRVETELKTKHVLDQRIVEYLQAVIVSTPRGQSTAEATDGQLIKLYTLLERMFGNYELLYFAGRSAALSKDSDYEPEKDAFYTKIMMYWSQVRGKCYPVFIRSQLIDFLEPHSEVINRIYGIDAKTLIDAVWGIVEKQALGGQRAKAALQAIENRFRKSGDEAMISNASTDDERHEIFHNFLVHHDLQAQYEWAMNILFGTGLYEIAPSTSVPLLLLTDLSHEPGDDETFFAEGDQPGWPTRRPPTWDRPLLKYRGKFYCFDVITLTDHFYRNIERRIRTHEPTYVEEWNRRQKSVSEELPLRLLSALLPMAKVFKSAYYPWRNPDTGKDQLVEVDGLILFDGLLLVVEVKAGSFLTIPPMPDLKRYSEALERLVQDPAIQGRRFLATLRELGEVQLFDSPSKHRTPLGSIRLIDVQESHVTAISLDQLGAIATSIQHTALAGQDRDQPVWRLSVDDLRVYTDMFRSPLEFCHFLTIRKSAYGERILDLPDELEHLGLYLEHNNYVMHAKEAAKNADSVGWIGYTALLDDYYQRCFEGGQATMPRQDMPKVLVRILELLEASKQDGRRQVANHLLSMSGTARQEYEQVLLDLAKKAQEGKVVPHSMMGPIRITTILQVRGNEMFNAHQAIEHALACLSIPNENDRVLMLVTIGADGLATKVSGEVVLPSMITVGNQALINTAACKIKINRLRRALAIGRIGRNESCPCASGEKYKKCCLPLAGAR